MELSRAERRYYRKVLFSNGIEGALSKDGHIYLFLYEDIEKELSAYCKDKRGWFFNSTRDRYIAEDIGGYISVNPAFVDYQRWEILVIED